MPSPTHENLREYPVVIEVPIHWGDMDSFAHVNNLIYLRWAETARVDYLVRLGMWERYEQTKVGPIVASITCHYRRPLTYPDRVLVGARVAGIGNSSFKMNHIVVRAETGEVAAELESTLVYLDYNSGKSVRLPDDLRAAIARLEAGEAVRES